MKVAVVYNRLSRNVINLFGVPNRETIGQRQIRRIADALRREGHHVRALEGDKDLIDRLEEFMPRVVGREPPGLVFNLSYGIQGRARYTHVPSILEMVGLPYVGSGPVAHSVALDKVVTKMVLREHGLPTPDFAVLGHEDEAPPDLPFPLIVKPKHEAMSLGLAIVHDEAGLQRAVREVRTRFGQEALVERFVDGREVYVGLLGNEAPLAFPPVELVFDAGVRALLHEDKTGASGRKNRLAPAQDLPTSGLQELARRAFRAIGCNELARVDLRIDEEGQPWILEINTLPGMSDNSPYPYGAALLGMDFTCLVNRIVAEASQRWFGEQDEAQHASMDARFFHRVTKRRDRIERAMEAWGRVSSRSGDEAGIQEAARRFGARLGRLGLQAMAQDSDGHHVWGWQTPAGLEGGTLLVVALDVPLDEAVPPPDFHKEPEWLVGEGLGSSRAGLVMAEEALACLADEGLLASMPLAVAAVGDAGCDLTYSRAALERLSRRAARVLALDPVAPDEAFIVEGKGRAQQRVVLETRPRGEDPRLLEQALPALGRLPALAHNGAEAELRGVRSEGLVGRPPHRVVADLVVRYGDEQDLHAFLSDARTALSNPRARLVLTTRGQRPPLGPGHDGGAIEGALRALAEDWDIGLPPTPSHGPTLAGAAAPGVAALGGLGAPCADLEQPGERVGRAGLVQRILLLGLYLRQGARDGA